VTRYELSPRANARLDEIYAYTRETWGEAQAETYIRSLFECFERIARSKVVSRAIPAEFGIDGHYCRHERHIVYWRRLRNGAVGIVTILHQSMHLIDRLNEDSE